MAKGAGAAYNNLRTPSNDLSQSIQFWGQQQGQTLDNIAARKEREGVRQEQKFDSLKEKLGFDEDELISVATGHETFDDVTRTFGSRAVKDATKWEIEAARRLNEEGDINGFNEALGKSKQIQYEIKNWNKNAEKVGVKIADYAKKVQEGKINPNDDTALILDAAIKHNYIPIPDENGKLRLLVGVDLDKDGEVSEEERKAAEFSLKRGSKDSRFKEIRPIDMINGKYDPFEKVELKGEDGLINQLASTIGILEKEIDSGLYKRTTEGFDETKRAQLDATVKATLEDPETLSWVLTQATAGREGGASKKTSRNIEDYTKEEKEIAKNYLASSVINSYDEKEGKTFLTGKANYEKSVRDDSIEDEDGVVDAILVTDLEGNPSVKSNDEQRPSSDPMSKEPREFRFQNKAGESAPITGVLENPSEQILSVIKRGDRYYAKTRIPSESSTKSENWEVGGDTTTTRTKGGKVRQIPLTDTELNLLAGKLKLQNAAELDNYLEGKLNKNSEQKASAKALINKYRNK